MCASSATRTPRIRIRLSSLFMDFREQLSWGRICAAVALAVAVRAQFTGADVAHVALWLGVAVGNYGASKLTEILCGKKIAVEAAVSGKPLVSVEQPKPKRGSANVSDLDGGSEPEDLKLGGSE